MIKEVCAFLLPHLDAKTCSCHFPSSLPPPTVISISGKQSMWERRDSRFQVVTTLN